MLGNICCVMLVRGRLSDRVCKQFFHAARIAVCKGCEEVLIQDGMCFGVVRTKMRNATIGTVSGILFSGKIESDTGVAEATFIVRSRDLKELDEDGLAWVSGVDIATTHGNRSLTKLN